MRPFILAVLLLAAVVPDVANAAQSSWLAGIFAQPVQAARRPAHRPAAGVKKAVVPEAAPVPLPRPRPELRDTAAAQDTPAADGDKTPAPATPAASAAGSSATASSPAAPDKEPAAPTSRSSSPTPATAEGESTTPKPPRIYQTACPAVISGLVEAKPLPPINDGMCQTQSPLSVTSILVNGRTVPLSVPATFTCEMATDLPGWVADVDNYLWSSANTRIKSVIVGGSYECRPRNVEGGSSDLSEHGRADALDFVGFTLEDGRQLTVTADYNSSDLKISRLMHFAHDAACSRFTTVLGPNANALHRDHFHLDLGCHGKTCTYRLCE